MQLMLRTMGISALALIASGATLQTAPAERPLARAGVDEGVAPITSSSVVDAQTGQLIAGAEQISTSTQLVIRAAGYQEVRIATAAGVGATQVPHGPREVALCPVGASDRDADGLCDSAEQRYHTALDSVDTDGDAIPDRIEIYGEALPDGTAFSVEAYGASPYHRDVFVYVNWTNRWPVKQAALDRVVSAFASAPMGTNADQTIGINVHFLLGGEITFADDLPYTEEELVVLRKLHLPYPVSFPFHYLIFSDYLKERDASGISPNIPGENFIVTLAGVPNLDLLGEAGTIMHELGHNLGLRHGGSDDDNYKPQYLSVMNYAYQFDGLQRSSSDQAPRVLDYARFSTDRINEKRLNETVGFPVSADPRNELVTHYHPLYCRKANSDKNMCLEGGWLSGSVPGSLDFNGNGRIDPPSVLRPLRGDLNGDGLLSTIEGGRNDWATLSFNPKAPGAIRVMTDVPKCPIPDVSNTPASGPIPMLDESPDPTSDEPGPTPTEPPPTSDEPGPTPTEPPPTSDEPGPTPTEPPATDQTDPTPPTTDQPDEPDEPAPDDPEPSQE